MKRIYSQCPWLCVIVVIALASSATCQTSQWVFTGSNGKLQYKNLPNGDHILDFSHAGYEGGGVSLPNATVKVTISAVSGDNTSNIQNAINRVAAMPVGANGIRGAVLLDPGTYNVSGTLNLNASGVILRGSGSGSGGTILNMTGSPHLLIAASGSGSWSTTGSAVNMTDHYVPSGALSFHVSSTSGFSVGNTVLIHRPVTQAWVHLMGMDTLKSNTGTPQTWISVGSVIDTDRTIAAINGNQITLDAPLADNFDSSLLQGSIERYTFSGRISQVGVEHLKVTAPAVDVIISSPQFTGISFDAIIDAWMEDVAFVDTQNTVTVGNSAKRLTLDKVNISHTVTHTGDRMADFGLSGTQIFVNNSSSDGNGEWPLLTQGEVSGPLVALNFNSTQQAGVGPHQRWAVGLLCDNCNLPDAPNNPDGGATGISYSDRGNHGSGQGWAMGWGVAWNVTTPYLVVQEPPGDENWCIGCIGNEISAVEAGSGKTVPNGIFDSRGTKVTPNSLYLAQLCDRLGSQALTNIGYSGSCATTSPTPTPTPRPTPTATPIPTATPKPTATATPKPSATPTPRGTVTPTPKPTVTPKPTATPAPTATAKPTATATGSTCAKAWAPNVSYVVGEIASYNGKNYRCLQSHTSLTGWEPPNVPALWSVVGVCH